VNFKTVFKQTLLFSGCFLSVVLLLVCGYTVGILSARVFAVVLSVLIGVSWVVVAFGTVKLGGKGALRIPYTSAARPLSSGTRKQRLFAIRTWELMIVLLALEHFPK
jgi:hypothetical protein